jgi:hypothetical protein
MNRTNVVLLVGALVAAAGALLAWQAGPLATQWQPLGGGGWGGTTDPALRQTYRDIGLVVLGLGAGLLLMGTWRWLGEGRGEPPGPG